MSDAAEPLDLGPIRERVEAATKGPWDAADEHGLMPNSEPAWCVSNVADDEVWLGDVFYTPDHPQAQANSEFAAHARQDVPALLAEVDRLRAEIATARRDALTEAADEITEHQAVAGMFNADKAAGLERAAILIRVRAAQEEGGSTLTPDERREWAADECAQERDAQEEDR